MQPLNNDLDNFFKFYINSIASQTGKLPIIEYDPDWPSPCQQGAPFDYQNKNHHGYNKPISKKVPDSIYWQPTIRETNTDLSGLEQALETKLHPDLKTFFTRYWSEQIDVIFQQGNLSLMFVWNKEDMERLIENQIGHALNRLRNNQTLTFFIACTDSDYIISIENDSGNVALERSGYAIEKILANSLSEFINALKFGRLT